MQLISMDLFVRNLYNRMQITMDDIGEVVLLLCPPYCNGWLTLCDCCRLVRLWYLAAKIR